ncbi:hypothetical protein [Furfurilactobacillus rossiae]|uniref:Uncharacterized protein n=1 Tax=Furfurilactobacillus rossiae DSM 15814 TaxID=1114972 RepID=A0A0R1RIR1_9LACO|nr:hypothetical protein [Furfurilactobacillus rossiae]KRL56572.1 hypothetical protein FD35_GL001666 [Furfurilactobacillus rossiae DSM 15814]QFR66523.1 hypothetical protein LR814_05195 [Furfurilactobacillus rossiae]QLE61989.1 LPXTG-motif cell wall anchor domain [Furfurilactobacillus rossiae]
MKRIISIGVTFLSVLVLSACGNSDSAQHSNSNSVKQSKVSKTHKQVSPSVNSATNNSASSSSTNQAAESSSNSNQATTSGPQFPSSFQRTWFGYNSYTHNIDTITFSNNRSTDSSGDSSTIHSTEERTNDDNAILNAKKQPTTPEEKQKLDHWGLFNEVHLDNGENWINIMGWYQTAGDGEFYRVANENINGQSTPVLFDAGGAEIWINEHYYTSKDIALQMKDKNFPGDRTRDDNDSDSNDQSDSDSDTNDSSGDDETDSNDDTDSNNDDSDDSTSDSNDNDSDSNTQQSDSDSDQDSSSSDDQDDSNNTVDSNNDDQSDQND